MVIVGVIGFYSLNNSLLYHGLYTIENGSFAHYDSIYIYMVQFLVLVIIALDGSICRIS